MRQIDLFIRRLESNCSRGLLIGRRAFLHLAGRADRNRTQVMIAVIVMCGSYFCSVSLVPSASGDVGGEVGVSKAIGFDSCGIPPMNSDRYLYNHEDKYGARFAYMGFYIGGAIPFPVGGGNCNRPSKAQVNKLHAIGYDFLLIMDGRQPPCSIQSTLFFRDDGTNGFRHAREAGEIEAEAAVKNMKELGFTVPGSIVYYDIESFDSEDQLCLNATKEFVASWDRTLQSRWGVSAGLYGPTGGSDLKAFWSIEPKPDDLWFSETYVGEKEVPIPQERVETNQEYESVWNPSNVHPSNPTLPESFWPNRRLHQWEREEPFKQIAAPHKKYHLDITCAMGLVAGSGGKKPESRCQAK